MCMGVPVLCLLLFLIVSKHIVLSVEVEYVLIICAVAFFACMFVYFSVRVMNPVKKMVRVFELFNRGYIYDEVFNSNFFANEEMQKTMEKFESMLDRKGAANLAKKQVEYLTLRDQINPHFLYNTLESLRAEALLGGLDSVAGMAETLAKFYRYTISNKENLVTLEDEVENVKNYFAIQKFRFGDRIELDIQCDDKDMLLKCYTLKLTLQPLVENAIQHGLEMTRKRKGAIELAFERTKNFVFISVRDYGVGIEEKKVEELNRMFREPDKQISVVSSNKNTGIALRNVNARIKLLFGMEYGLQILGAVNLGTEVRITLPKIYEEDIAVYSKKLEMESGRKAY